MSSLMDRLAAYAQGAQGADSAPGTFEQVGMVLLWHGVVVGMASCCTCSCIKWIDHAVNHAVKHAVNHAVNISPDGRV